MGLQRPLLPPCTRFLPKEELAMALYSQNKGYCASIHSHQIKCLKALRGHSHCPPPTAAPILLIPAPLCSHRSRYAGFLAIAQETLCPRGLTGLFLQIIVSAQNLLFNTEHLKKKKKSNFTTPHFSSAALFFLQSLAHLAYYALLFSYLSPH